MDDNILELWHGTKELIVEKSNEGIVIRIIEYTKDGAYPEDALYIELPNESVDKLKKFLCANDSCGNVKGKSCEKCEDEKVW